jgi:hypothetical protein
MNFTGRRTTMQKFYMRTFAILLGSVGSVAFAAPAGALLFSQEGAQIIDAAGVTRPARQGDVLQTGERLLTPPNGISQVKLPDGSLISVRPGTEMRIDPPPAGAPTQQQIALIHGAVRVIGAELMDKRKASAITLQTGQASLQMKGADIESAVVRPDSQRPKSQGDAGSYNRLQLGAVTLHSGAVTEPLPLRLVSFVPLASFQQITLPSVSQNVFGSGALLGPVPNSALSSGAALSGKISSNTSTLTSGSLSGLGGAGALANYSAANQQNAFTPNGQASSLAVAGQSKAAALPSTTVLTKVLFQPPPPIKPRLPICSYTLKYGTVCR